MSALLVSRQLYSYTKDSEIACHSEDRLIPQPNAILWLRRRSISNIKIGQLSLQLRINSHAEIAYIIIQNVMLINTKCRQIEHSV